LQFSWIDISRTPFQCAEIPKFIFPASNPDGASTKKIFSSKIAHGAGAPRMPSSRMKESSTSQENQSMTTLQSLTSAGTTPQNTFPGYTLSPPRLVDYAEAEQEAAQHYLHQTAKAAAASPSVTREAFQHRAIDNLRLTPFAFGSPQFDAWATSMSAVPFLAWLLLRIKHPELTLAHSAQLLNGPDSLPRARAVWALWGYTCEKKVEAARSMPPPTPPPISRTDPDAPSTGHSSSAD
jgi:hypothetical protein